MKKNLFLAAAVLGALTSIATAAETVVLTETFESYADQTALETAYTASAAGVITLQTTSGDGAEGSNKFITMPSASAATLTKTAAFGPFTPTDGDPLSITAWLRSANWANSRNGVSVRDTTLAAGILNVGSYNATTANLASPGDKFVIRTAGYGIGSSGYWTLANGINRPVSTWTKLKLTGGGTFFRAYINDVNSPADDGSTTSTPATTATQAAAFSVLRIGLGVTTPNPFDVDSITVATGLAVTDVQDWDLYN